MIIKKMILNILLSFLSVHSSFFVRIKVSIGMLYFYVVINISKKFHYRILFYYDKSLTKQPRKSILKNLIVALRLKFTLYFSTAIFKRITVPLSNLYRINTIQTWHVLVVGKSKQSASFELMMQLYRRHSKSAFVTFFVCFSCFL